MKLMNRVAQAAARALGSASEGDKSPTLTPYQERCRAQLQTIEGARQLLQYLNAAGRPNNGTVPYQAVFARDNTWKQQLDAVQARVIGLEVLASIDSAASAREAARTRIGSSIAAAEKAVTRAQAACQAKAAELAQLRARIEPLRQAADAHDHAALADAQREHAELKARLGAADADGRDDEAADLAKQLQAVQSQLTALQREAGLPSPAALRVQAMAEVEARLLAELVPLERAASDAADALAVARAELAELDYHEAAASLLLAEAEMKKVLQHGARAEAIKRGLPRPLPVDGLTVCVTRAEYVPGSRFVAMSLERAPSARLGAAFVHDRLMAMHAPLALDLFANDPTTPWPGEAETVADMRAEDAARDANLAAAKAAVGQWQQPGS
jgi:hypothetical protein